MIGNEFQYRAGCFSYGAGNSNAPATATADLCYELENLLELNALASENIAMSELSPFHGKDQSRGNIAHVNEVHDEIQIEL